MALGGLDSHEKKTVVCPEVQTGVQLLEVLSNEDGVRFVRLSQRLGFELT